MYKCTRKYERIHAQRQVQIRSDAVLDFSDSNSATTTLPLELLVRLCHYDSQVCAQVCSHGRTRTHESAHTKVHVRKRTHESARTHAHVHTRTHTRARTYTEALSGTHALLNAIVCECTHAQTHARTSTFKNVISDTHTNVYNWITLPMLFLQ